MMLHRFATNHKPNKFLPGDLVEVRSTAEILSTLDEKGTLENLPFMPEMLPFCGRQFRVSRRAFKTCVDDQEMRRLENSVFLEDLRCDGKSHGGCAKACLIFWKEAWLKPVGSSASTNGSSNPKLKPSDLVTLSSRDGQFFCQSSEILNASSPLPFWQPKQYLWDLTQNRVSLFQWAKSLLISVYNKVAHKGGFRSWGFVAGPGTQNGARVSLSLKKGDRVRVKSLAQIKETLNADGSISIFCSRRQWLSFVDARCGCKTGSTRSSSKEPRDNVKSKTLSCLREPPATAFVIACVRASRFCFGANVGWRK